MSGTSYDGIDVCAISVDKEIKLLYFSSFGYPPKLRKEIASVIENQVLSLRLYGELNIKIGHAFSKAINAFIKKNNIAKTHVSAIGLSGQTLWHQPSGKYPFSMQAGDPVIVAQECGIKVVSDFRNDHIRLGGEGAPLVPEFHQKIFSSLKQARLIINIGGIANYSYLTKEKGFIGSDSGPGNALIDSYCQKYLNCNFDRKGLIARKGSIHQPSLKKMLAHAFFQKRDPKSTGKETFNLQFIPQNLLKHTPENILATLTELTAVSIARVIKTKEKSLKEVILCGGGINNTFMLERISHYTALPLCSSELFGYQPQSIEAMAFGWLARQRVNKQPLIVKNNKGVLGKITTFKL
jgi:anhydro-N-acetylmuramic acid kinase